VPELEKFKPDGSPQPRVTRLTGNIVITGATGAIGTQSGIGVCGVIFTKNGLAGRYDAVLHRSYKRTLASQAGVSSPIAGSVPVVTDGNEAYVTGISGANYGGTSPILTFTVQCCTTNGTPAAANPKSGDIVNWSLEVSDA
jgi:hypothetical protein